jgi:hypothetical protein
MTDSTHCLKCGVREGQQHHPGCGTPPASPDWIHAIRDYYGLASTSTEDHRRALAAEQAAESRAQRQRDPVPLPDIPVPIQVPYVAPCPGEFGPGGTFRDHCRPHQEAS